MFQITLLLVEIRTKQHIALTLASSGFAVILKSTPADEINVGLKNHIPSYTKILLLTNIMRV